MLPDLAALNVAFTWSQNRVVEQQASHIKTEQPFLKHFGWKKERERERALKTREFGSASFTPTKRVWTQKQDE